MTTGAASTHAQTHKQKNKIKKKNTLSLLMAHFASLDAVAAAVSSEPDVVLPLKRFSASVSGGFG